MADQNNNFQQFYHLSPIVKSKGEVGSGGIAYIQEPTSSQVAHLGFLSQIEQEILRSSSPIDLLQDSHEVTVNGVKGKTKHLKSLKTT